MSGCKRKGSHGIPEEVLQRLRERDSRCVYCGKQYSTTETKDKASIEHLDENGPGLWKDGLTEEGLAFCCRSCNSSRGKLSLLNWFQKPYCRGRAINGNTVAEPVKRYLDRDAGA